MKEGGGAISWWVFARLSVPSCIVSNRRILLRYMHNIIYVDGPGSGIYLYSRVCETTQ